MKLFGWRRPDIVRVYTHLTMQNVDDKDLVLHGLKRKEEEVLRPIVMIQMCPGCQTENAPVAVYCSSCGMILNSASSKDVDAVIDQIIKDKARRERLIRALREDLGVKLAPIEKWWGNHTVGKVDISCNWVGWFLSCLGRIAVGS